MALTPMKRIRMEKGLLQWQVAQKVGVSESYLSRIECGRREPDGRLLTKIARALGVRTSDLRIESRGLAAAERSVEA